MGDSFPLVFSRHGCLSFQCHEVATDSIAAHHYYLSRS
jgi:hypothetical protein